MGESAIDITEAERGAVIAWLHRRARMCQEATRWYRPFRRAYLRHLAGCFKASALAIKEGAHLAGTLQAESEALRRAMAHPRSPSPTNPLNPEMA